MPANDLALRRAIGRQANAIRWGHPEVALEAAREAAALQLEHQIRRTVTGLTADQRLHLAGLLTAGNPNAA